jgi:predicted transcriptional regulator
VVAQLGKEASQTRDYCVAKNATHRAARPDPSLRLKNGYAQDDSHRIVVKLHHYLKLLTLSLPVPSLVGMDVPLNPDLQAKLRRLAEEQGRASAALIVEDVERLVNYDEWFLREVDKGLAAADNGQLVDHSAVKKMIDERYPD